MSSSTLKTIARTGLRLALATAFLSSVLGRFGLWGPYSSGWASFVKYSASVNWYLPAALVEPITIVATIFESAFGLALLIGFRVRWAAFGSAALLMLFALAMFSGNPKSPFDYSVFTASFAALFLAVNSD